jgi:hypothetical protein
LFYVLIHDRNAWRYSEWWWVILEFSRENKHIQKRWKTLLWFFLLECPHHSQFWKIGRERRERVVITSENVEVGKRRRKRWDGTRKKREVSERWQVGRGEGLVFTNGEGSEGWEIWEGVNESAHNESAKGKQRGYERVGITTWINRQQNKRWEGGEGLVEHWVRDEVGELVGRGNEWQIKMFNTAFWKINVLEGGESGKEVLVRLTEGEVGERGKGGKGAVVRLTKGEVGERGKGGNQFVECPSGREMGERRKHGNHKISTPTKF